MRANLFDLDYEELSDVIQGWNEPGYRTQQIWQGIFQKFWNNFEEFTTLSLPLRKKLDQHFIIGGLNPEKDLQSNDGSTRKILYRLQDKAAIETVLMGYPDRNTVCISSQVGCGMGCNFCATGNMGFEKLDDIQSYLNKSIENNSSIKITAVPGGRFVRLKS